jgi:hypothetical protein
MLPSRIQAHPTFVHRIVMQSMRPFVCAMLVLLAMILHVVRIRFLLIIFHSRLLLLAQVTNQVYEDDNPAAPNITGLTTSICARLFGSGAKQSSRGRYCTCKTEAFPVQSNTYCRENTAILA